MTPSACFVLMQRAKHGPSFFSTCSVRRSARVERVYPSSLQLYKGLTNALPTAPFTFVAVFTDPALVQTITLAKGQLDVGLPSQCLSTSLLDGSSVSVAPVLGAYVF